MSIISETDGGFSRLYARSASQSPQLADVWLRRLRVYAGQRSRLPAPPWVLDAEIQAATAQGIPSLRSSLEVSTVNGIEDAGIVPRRGMESCQTERISSSVASKA